MNRRKKQLKTAKFKKKIFLGYIIAVHRGLKLDYHNVTMEVFINI